MDDRGRGAATERAIAASFAGPPGPPPRITHLTAKGAATRVRGVGAQRLLDPEELVVLRHAVRARRRAGLDLAAAGRHGEVRDRRVLGLARAVGHHGRVAGIASDPHRLERLGERPYLVDLHE